MWVSYVTIQLLCDKLSLSQQLAPLLRSSFEITDEVGLRPSPALEDYIGYYRTVTSGETTVYIKASDYKVNANHIAIAAGRTSPVQDVLVALHVKWTVVNRGLQCSKGKYIGMDGALALCNHFGMSDLKERLQDVEVKPTGRHTHLEWREKCANCQNQGWSCCSNCSKNKLSRDECINGVVDGPSRGADDASS